MVKRMAFVRAVVLVSGLGLAYTQFLQLPALPYAYDALQPFISEDIMRVHHLGHHVAYMNRTNQVLAELRGDPSTHDLAKKGLDWLLRHSELVPAKQGKVLKNHGGGYVNHDFFWQIMSPPSGNGGAGGVGGVIDETLPLAQSIIATFGSISNFRAMFKQAALGVFGSGWVWLELRAMDASTPILALTTTANQDGPFHSLSGHALIGLDLWEHAYYLQYKNKRADYIDAFWSVLNFEAANALYVTNMETFSDRSTVRAVEVEAEL